MKPTTTLLLATLLGGCAVASTFGDPDCEEYPYLRACVDDAGAGPSGSTGNGGDGNGGDNGDDGNGDNGGPGNPGNDKDVGHAGEDPGKGGHSDPTGSKGKGDSHGRN